MVVALNPKEIASRLGAMFGLALEVSEENIDGGNYPVVRPVEPPRPNGFSVVIAKTPLRLESAFRLDSFARGLLSRMSDADAQARESFTAIRKAAQAKDIRSTVIVGGDSVGIEDVLPPPAQWTAIEIECDARLADSQPAEEQAILVAATSLALALALIQPEDVLVEDRSMDGLPEGASVRVEVNRYERSPVNRAVCIAYYGAVCAVCDMDFRSVYGPIGEGYIHVHHRTRVADIGADYVVNPVKDLIPVCPNCHAMLHTTNPPMTVEFLRDLLRQHSGARGAASKLLDTTGEA